MREALRFIPTCVGNTASIAEATAALGGSSPRAWGIPMYNQLTGACARFIPTCVGNTSGDSESCSIRAVHPHVRGEYIIKYVYSLDVYGSSPRAWGIHAATEAHQIKTRFIPTCVGNTLPAFLPSRLPAGSSPRAWGIRRGRDGAGRRPRFIPTCVGNTPTARWSCWASTVHPHVRGEYL